METHEGSGILRIRLEGPAVRENRIALSDLADLARHLQTAVFRVAAVLLGQDARLKTGRIPRRVEEECTLELVGFGADSVELVLDLKNITERGRVGVPGRGELVVELLLRGVPELAQGTGDLPAGYDHSVLHSWQEMGRILDRGVNSMTCRLAVGGGELRAVYNLQINRRIADRLHAPAPSKRTVVGRLLMGDFKETGYRCRVHPAVGPPVKCTFDQAHRDAVLGALTKPVRVVGEATEKDGRIVSLDIAEIDVLQGPEATGTGEDALDFENPVSIHELALLQGVKPVSDLSKLAGDFWPEDEDVDDFVAAVRAWREAP